MVKMPKLNDSTPNQTKYNETNMPQSVLNGYFCQKIKNKKK